MSGIKEPDPDGTKYQPKTDKQLHKVTWGGWSWSVLTSLVDKVSKLATPIINAGYETKAQKSQRIRKKFQKGVQKAKVIGKGLSKPGTKAIEESYWQEVLLKGHPSAETYHDLFALWESTNTKLAFEDWIVEKGYISKRGVQYLDETERKKYIVKIKEGKFFQNDLPYDTTYEQTNFSGLGSAIFVIGPDNKLYAGSHIFGKFHHSSFLAGGASKGAGEIKTDAEGNLTSISSKSGHYKPTKTEMVNTLKILQAQGVLLQGVELKLLTKEGIVVYADAQAFLDNPDTIPIGWESYKFERDANGNISKISLNDVNVSVRDIPNHLKRMMNSLGIPKETIVKINTSAGFVEYSIEGYLKNKNVLPNKWEGGELILESENKLKEIRPDPTKMDENYERKLVSFLSLLEQKKASLEDIQISFPNAPPVTASKYLEDYKNKF